MTPVAEVGVDPAVYEPHFSHRWRPAIVVVAVAVLSPALLLGPVGVRQVVGVAFVSLQTAAFWWMGRWPRLVTAAVLVAGALLQIVFPQVGLGLGFVALCTFAWLRPARESGWALVATAVVSCGPPAWGHHWGQAGLWLAAVLLAWSWGALGRARGARLQAESARAVLEERARIARELHDVLSHTVSVMVVQAAAAEDVFDTDPAQARVAVQRIESSGRQALAELRWFLGAVRGEREQSSDPQPTLWDLDRLADTMAAAGLQVAIRREGTAEAPPALQLTAYRIVQEALTNSLRHGHAEHADLLVRTCPGEVVVEVSDNGDSNSPGAPGHGIIGMRERAALHGGEFQAGPRPDGGGFLVRAQLPWREPE